MYVETAMKEFGMLVFEATMHIKKYEKRWLESHYCANKSPKTLLINMLWL